LEDEGPNGIVISLTLVVLAADWGRGTFPSRRDEDPTRGGWDWKDFVPVASGIFSVKRAQTLLHKYYLPTTDLAKGVLNIREHRCV